MSASAMNDLAWKDADARSLVAKWDGKSQGHNGTAPGPYRVHILSGFISGTKILLTLVSIFLLQNLDHVGDMIRAVREQDVVQFSSTVKARLLGGLAAALVVSAAVSLLSWSRKSYELKDEEFVYTFGVLFRNKKSARYDRIQAVDVKQPLFPRLLGLAQVGIETAGGKDSRFAIEYVSSAEAERLCKVLFDKAGMRGVDGERHDNLNTSASGAATEVLAHIPRSLMIVSVIPEMIFALVMTGAATAMQATSQHQSRIVLLVVVVLPILLNAYKSLNRRWDFTLSLNRKKQQLTLSYGLGDVSRQSVPLARIHGVKLYQPWWWRPVGLWRVQVSMAGYGVTSLRSEVSVILPCGRRQTAQRVLARIMPLAGAEEQKYFESAAEHARYTYSPRVRWLRPWTYKHNAADLIGGTHAVTYGGRFSRAMACSRLEHIQEISLKQGPLQRKFGVATVEMHLVIGPVDMEAVNLELCQARDLLNRLNKRKLPRDGRCVLA